MTKVLEPHRKYVCGFMFDTNSRVLLIEKVRPDWQAGRLNGIGGRVEDGETEHDAMCREFKEETGIDCPSWSLFAVLRDARGWPVYFYYSIGNIYSAEVLTDEYPVIIEVCDMETDRRLIPNLRWLIPMALSMRFEKLSHFSIEECATTSVLPSP